MAVDVDEARAAFERGDFAETRRLARAVLARDAGDDEIKAARELLGRVSSDRAVLLMFGACLLFFVVLVGLFLVRG